MPEPWHPKNRRPEHANRGISMELPAEGDRDNSNITCSETGVRQKRQTRKGAPLKGGQSWPGLKQKLLTAPLKGRDSLGDRLRTSGVQPTVAAAHSREAPRSAWRPRSRDSRDSEARSRRVPLVRSGVSGEAVAPVGINQSLVGFLASK